MRIITSCLASVFQLIGLNAFWVNRWGISHQVSVYPPQVQLALSSLYLSRKKPLITPLCCLLVTLRDLFCSGVKIGLFRVCQFNLELLGVGPNAYECILFISFNYSPWDRNYPPHLRPLRQPPPESNRSERLGFGRISGAQIKAAAARNHPSGLSRSTPAFQSCLLKNSEASAEARQAQDEKRRFHSWLSRKRQKRDTRNRRNPPQIRPEPPNLSICLIRIKGAGIISAVSLHFRRIYHFSLYYYLPAGLKLYIYFLLSVFYMEQKWFSRTTMDVSLPPFSVLELFVSTTICRAEEPFHSEEGKRMLNCR